MIVNSKKIVEILHETPEVRRNKIAVLKKAIAEGTYQIRADEIATKILKDLLLELALNTNVGEYRECGDAVWCKTHGWMMGAG